MSMETEYEEDLEEQSESPESRIIDGFFEELAKGNRIEAAKKLRVLHAASGSLIASDLELVSELLIGTDFGEIFPWRLGFERRRRGRPPRHSPQNQLSAPWIAFAKGDEAESAKALLELKFLGGPDLETFAGLMDDDPALKPLFPCRLVLMRKSGRPKTMRTGARQFATAFIAAAARTRMPKKRAIGDVCDRTKLSRATVYSAEKAIRDKSRN
jgi:hypothetical protein